MENTIILLFVVFFPITYAFVGYFIGKRNEEKRDIYNILVTGINLLIITSLYRIIKVQPIDFSLNHIMGTGLHLRLDGFRYIFVWITSLIWFLTTIYSVRYLKNRKNRNRYTLYSMLTFGCTLGVFISENLINLFTFFEIMSFTSYTLIIHDEDEYSHRAGFTYIIMAVGGGLLLLMGLFLLYNYTQTLEISKLYLATQGIGKVKYAISALIVIGFGVKAGMVPLHIWLAKAYTAAPVPGTAILSSVLSKTGIFGIILIIDIMLRGDIYASTIIIIFGFINILTGGFLAMFQRNIKRILAYSSMSQIGYMFLGIGLIGLLKEHSGIAIYGTLIHAVNHAFQKGLLFMGAGILYVLAKDLSINKMIGLGRKKIALMIAFMIGILGTIGFPGLNGFLSKTLLHEALSEAHHMYGGEIFIAAEILFIIGSSFTVAYLLKLFVAVFIDKSQEEFEDFKGKHPEEFVLPLVILSGIIIYMGLNPGMVLNLFGPSLNSFGISGNMDIHFYSFEAVKSSLVAMVIGAAIYMVFIRKLLFKQTGAAPYYINPIENWFDIERHIYRPLGKLAFNICTVLFNIIDVSIVGSASYVSNAFEKLGKIELKSRESIHTKIADKLNYTLLPGIDKVNIKIHARFENLKDIKVMEEQSPKTFNIKERIGQTAYRMNSITYSVFIFAIALVICLLLLII